jgi:hypothetical protein
MYSQAHDFCISTTDGGESDSRPAHLKRGGRTEVSRAGKWCPARYRTSIVQIRCRQIIVYKKDSPLSVAIKLTRVIK